MEQMEIKGIGEQKFKDVLQQNASIVDGKYYYLPFWFEKVDNNNNIGSSDFKLHHLENIPDELKETVLKLREHPFKKENNND